jgi:hypothetical protein
MIILMKCTADYAYSCITANNDPNIGLELMNILDNYTKGEQKIKNNINYSIIKEDDQTISS